MSKSNDEYEHTQSTARDNSVTEAHDGHEYVRWAYRLLLGRDPESIETIANNPFLNNRRRLVQSILESDEFRNSYISVDRQNDLSYPREDRFDLSSIEDRRLREYALAGYNTIDGWGVNDYLINIFLSLDHYQKSRSIVGNVFEIGVFHGRVLILLGLATQASERVVGLDIFETFQSHNIDKSGGHTTKGIVERNLERYGLKDKAELIVGDSLFVDFSKHPALSNIRFAHIDGAHYVDALVNDLVKTQQIMVPGGIIVVDDYTHMGFPGVSEGCHRFLSFATPRLVVPFAAGSNKLFLTTHSHHSDLINYLREMVTERPLIKIHGFDAVSLSD
jgi:hypothetical protein